MIFHSAARIQFFPYVLGNAQPRTGSMQREREREGSFEGSFKGSFKGMKQWGFH